MGEFLEYIRQLHYKLCGGPPKKHKGAQLDHDSIDEVTDLDEPGILTTSDHLLSEDERRKLRKYVNEMRSMQSLEPKKHDCGVAVRSNWISKTITSNKTMMEMELKAIQKPLPTRHFEIDAHQFSEHSAGNQADSDEQEEINLQTDLIDLK